MLLPKVITLDDRNALNIAKLYEKESWMFSPPRMTNV